MSPEEQRIAIAEACGWKGVTETLHGIPCGISPKGNGQLLPDYLGDLNAMHEAEKVIEEALPEEKFDHYASYLVSILRGEAPNPRIHWSDYISPAITATAAQRAEALLRTLGLWKD